MIETAASYRAVRVQKILYRNAAVFLLKIRGRVYWIPRSHIWNPGGYDPGNEDCWMRLSEEVLTQKGL